MPMKATTSIAAIDIVITVTIAIASTITITITITITSTIFIPVTIVMSITITTSIVPGGHEGDGRPPRSLLHRVRFGSVRFGPVRSGSVRTIDCPGSTRFGLRFSDASWLGPESPRMSSRGVPARSDARRAAEGGTVKVHRVV